MRIIDHLQWHLETAVQGTVKCVQRQSAPISAQLWPHYKPQEASKCVEKHGGSEEAGFDS